ncbi:hypothetical protein [Halanaerobacter jeridensis]|uniref:UbiC transcription regulator-associated domain-containing protein n=1 Tax=Halanaerobacter jeridensis TaxID=706427 RepID=A0A939BQE0_9FIRM|nr:hypothetical protein [Halanaerobacter jeridensis]MBM7558038.1 hypothetical protein [Halanaerobacter jeridensis]
MSSREVKECNLYELTKKERVIYLAQEDPFLKVEKIAQLAETTSHYVRTVLSEADLSLTKLRENYARKKVSSSEENKLVFEVLELSELGNINYEVQENLILNQSYEFVKQGSKQIAETVLFKEDERPLFISSTFFASKLAITEIKQLKKVENVRFSAVELEVEKGRQQLLQILNSKPGSYLLTLKKKLYFSDQLQGINVVYFPVNQIKLNFNNSLQQIKVLKK